eukprot:scaffold16905_cov58-Phaeocystis_antarctica.AAC.7
MGSAAGAEDEGFNGGSADMPQILSQAALWWLTQRENLTRVHGGGCGSGERFGVACRWLLQSSRASANGEDWGWGHTDRGLVRCALWVGSWAGMWECRLLE